MSRCRVVIPGPAGVVVAVSVSSHIHILLTVVVYSAVLTLAPCVYVYCTIYQSLIALIQIVPSIRWNARVGSTMHVM